MHDRSVSGNANVANNIYLVATFSVVMKVRNPTGEARIKFRVYFIGVLWSHFDYFYF